MSYCLQKRGNAKGLAAAGTQDIIGERGGLLEEPLTPEREVGGSRPTSTMLCP